MFPVNPPGNQQRVFFGAAAACACGFFLDRSGRLAIFTSRCAFGRAPFQHRGHARLWVSFWTKCAATISSPALPRHSAVLLRNERFQAEWTQQVRWCVVVVGGGEKVAPRREFVEVLEDK